MALSVNSHVQDSATNALNIIDNTYSIASGSNRKLVLSCQTHDSNTANRKIDTCLWLATSFNTADVTSDAGSSVSTHAEIHHLDNPATGAMGLEIDAHAQVSFIALGGICYNGAATGALDNTAHLSGNSNSASTSITPVANNCIVQTALCCEPVPTAPGGIWTNIEAETGQSFQHADTDYSSAISPAASTTATYSLSYGAPWELCLASIAPYATVAASIPNKVYQIGQAINRSNTF